MEEKEGKELSYGWLKFRPGWLQFFNTPKWFLFFLCQYFFTQSIIVNGVYPGSISTIEKRFGFTRLVCRVHNTRIQARILDYPVALIPKDVVLKWKEVFSILMALQAKRLSLSSLPGVVSWFCALYACIDDCSCMEKFRHESLFSGSPNSYLILPKSFAKKTAMTGQLFSRLSPSF